LPLVHVDMTGFEDYSDDSMTPNPDPATTEDMDTSAPGSKGGFCQDGNTVVYGRLVHYHACAYFRGFFKLRYKCRATDVATGIQASASGYKSGKGAVEHAITNLFTTLVQRGIIPPPPGTARSSGTDTEIVHVDLGEEANEQLSSNFDDASDEEVPEMLPPVSIGEGVVSPVPMGGFCKDGNVEVDGRNIRWHACLYIKGFFLVRYKAIATDVATGIRGPYVRGFKSGKGAVEHAVAGLFVELVTQGVIPPPPIPPQSADYTGRLGAAAEQEIAQLPSNDETDNGVVDPEEPATSSPVPMGGFCQDGDTNVYNRAIHYHVCAYIHGFFKLRYKCTSRDVATGITGYSSGHHSGQGAVEHSVQNLIENLVRAGVIPPPPQAANGQPVGLDAQIDDILFP